MEPTTITADLCTAERETTMAIVSDGDIIAARQHGRTLVMQLGFSWPEATLVATAISELARNIILYANRGEIVLRAMEHEGRLGVLVIARDDGPGISDAAQKAIDDCPVRGDRRLGLRGMKQLVDTLEIVSQVGKGTTVAVTKWKT